MRTPSVFIPKIGAARKFSASAPSDAWVAYLPSSPTVGSIIYPSDATSDQVRTVYAREMNVTIQEVRCCRNSFFRRKYVKK